MTNEVQLLKDQVDKSNTTYEAMKANADKNVGEATTNDGASRNIERKLKETIQEHSTLKQFEPPILCLAFLKVK